MNDHTATTGETQMADHTEARETGHTDTTERRETGAQATPATVTPEAFAALQEQLRQLADTNAALLKENMAKKEKLTKAEREREERERKEAEARGEWEKIAKQREQELEQLRLTQKREAIARAAERALRARREGAPPIRDEAIDLALKAIPLESFEAGADGSIPGLEEAITGLRTQHAYLFQVEQGGNGKAPPSPGVGAHHPGQRGEAFPPHVLRRAKELGLSPRDVAAIEAVEWATPRDNKTSKLSPSEDRFFSEE